MKINGHSPIQIKKGSLVTGQWEGNCYRIIKALGEGGTAAVFLVRNKQGKDLAMKIASNSEAISHEYRMMTFLNNCPGIASQQVVPRVYELDDCQIGQTLCHYIITDYCKGINLGRYIGMADGQEAAEMGRQIADFLERLHWNGFVYGDLKPGNIIYNFRARKVWMTDFGSVTMKGFPLNQYTPGYDRENWQAGTRIADDSYDIFSFGVFLAVLTIGKIKTGDKGLDHLIARVNKKLRNTALRSVIIRALKQEIPGCREIAQTLSLMLRDQGPALRNETVNSNFY